MTSTNTEVPHADIGIIGLGVMGENLALNMSDHGFTVALFDRTQATVTRLIQRVDDRHRWFGSTSLEEFALALTRPRRILLMIKAGDPVDEMLEKLAPFLSSEDVVIDGGNSFFADTQRRELAMRARGVRFVGMGVSGGEEGARYGPSLMPGGIRSAYEHLRPIFESIAAKTESGPCVTYVGPDGAGHFVKMVHNGIEYGVMQVLAEAYDLMRRALGLTAPEVAERFAEWNRGPMASYLIEITSQILTVSDPETGRPLIDLILDQAGQKGTGKWTAQVALDLEVPIPTIAAALDARVLSSMKAERVHASEQYVGAGLAKRVPAATAIEQRAIRTSFSPPSAMPSPRRQSAPTRRACLSYVLPRLRTNGTSIFPRSRAFGRAAASSVHGCSARSCKRIDVTPTSRTSYSTPTLRRK